MEFTAVIIPVNVTNKAVIWSIVRDETRSATIDPSTRVLTAHGDSTGMVEVKATSGDGHVWATLNITVKPGGNVVSVSPVDTISVGNGTTIQQALELLPSTVTLNGTSTVAKVIWATPANFDGVTTGRYTFIGTLSLPTFEWTNTNNITARATVTVNPIVNVTTLSAIDTIIIPNETATTGAAIQIIQSAAQKVNLNGTDTTADVIWDLAPSEFDESNNVRYTFTGSLRLPIGWTNTNNLRPSIVVIMKKH